MSTPPTNVDPSSTAKKSRPRATPTPPTRGGAPHTDTPTASALPPSIPRAGATTRTPDHCKRPTASTTAGSQFTPVARRNTTRFTRASLPATAEPPSQNSFAVLDTTDDPGPPLVDRADDDAMSDNSDVGHTESTSREDGNSQPLLEDITDSIGNVFAATDRYLESTLAGIEADDRALGSAIRGVAASLEHDDDDDTEEPPVTLVPAPAPTMVSTMATTVPAPVPAPTMESMMLMLQSMQSSIIKRLDMMDSTKESLGQLRAAINSKAEATEIARLDRRLEDMAKTVRKEVNATIGTQLHSATSSIIDLKSNLSHLTKLQATTETANTTRIDIIAAHTTRLDSLATTCDNRFAALKKRITSLTNPRGKTVVDPSRGCNGSPSQLPSTVPPVGHVDAHTDSGNVVDDVPPTVDDDTVELVGTCPPPPLPPPTVRIHSPPVTMSCKSLDPAGTLPDGSTYTLPTGHFGSGISRGPTFLHPGLRHHSRDDSATRDAHSANAHAAHMAGPADAHLRTASHTPFCTVARPPQITPPPYTPPADGTDSYVRPPSPCMGGTITSPWEHQDRTKGVNRFDIEGLAHPLYHGRTHGVAILTHGFLANCGFNMVSSDDIIGCLNEIITAHRRITETWNNPSTNTSGPQIDRILLKSFKLFPKLESLATEDVVGFYDRFQKLSTAHLLALMPFNSIKLAN
jgi:hypothetical protein